MNLFSDPDRLQLPVVVMFVVAFALYERLKPMVRVEARRELKWDLIALVLVMVTGQAMTLALRYFFNLTGTQEFLSFLRPLRETPVWLRLSLAILMVDFGLYWVHRFMHTSWGWRTHVWHHSVKELYWLSGYRTSFVHGIIYYGIPLTIYFGIFRITMWEGLFLVGFASAVQLFTHANIEVHLGVLDKWIVTPRYHRLHHSRDEIRDKNFSTIFTVWDKIFGTYLNPDEYLEERPVGLDKEPPRRRMLLGV